MPLYCTDDTEAVIRSTFPYVFNNNQAEAPASFVPQLDFHRIKPAESFTVLGQRVLPVPLIHAQFHVLGFRIGDVAYCTDVNRIPEASMPLLEGLAGADPRRPALPAAPGPLRTAGSARRDRPAEAAAGLPDAPVPRIRP